MCRFHPSQVVITRGLGHTKHQWAWLVRYGCVASSIEGSLERSRNVSLLRELAGVVGTVLLSWRDDSVPREPPEDLEGFDDPCHELCSKAPLVLERRCDSSTAPTDFRQLEWAQHNITMDTNHHFEKHQAMRTPGHWGNLSAARLLHIPGMKGFQAETSDFHRA